MRKVLFKKWIPRESEKHPSGLGEITKKGTGCWSQDFTEKGLFHQWASAYEDGGEGFGNYTVALIELPCGEIQEVLPCNIKFIS